MNKIDKTFISLIIITFLLSLSDKSFLSIFSLIFWIYLIYLIYIYKKSKKEKISNNIIQKIPSPSLSNNYEPFYEIKQYLTPNEFAFYHKLLNVSTDLIIIPQVPLSSIVRKVNGKYQNELNRVIDFGIFDKNFRLLLLIELNDSSHNQINRRDRDLKVKKILDDCFIKLITFYTKYPNEQEYITRRINDALNITKES